MKNFVLLAVVLLGCVSSYGRQFEVGVNGGIANRWVKLPYTSEYNLSKYLSVLGVSVAYGTKKYAVGLSVSCLHRKYDYAPTFANIDDPEMASFSWGPTVESVHVSSNLIPVTLSGDKRFTFSSFQLYAGVVAGVSYGVAKVTYNYDVPTSNYSKYTHATDYFAGLHAGCTWYTGTHLGVNTEIAGERFDFISKPGKLPAKLYYVPVTVGVRYKL